jgi:hypothetical protein
MNTPFTVVRILLSELTTAPTFEAEFAPALRQPNPKFSYATQPNVRILYLADETPVLRFDTRIGLLDENKTPHLTCVVTSEFAIHHREVATSGINQNSQAFLAALFNLAQAYAIGVLATKLQELNLSNLRPATIVPPAFYGKDINRLLADLQTGRFKEPVAA